MLITQRLSAEEREVHIWIDNIERMWKVETSIPKFTNMFRKKGWKILKEEKDKEGNTTLAIFEAPEHALTIRKSEKVKRTITNEQHNAMVERLKLARESKKTI